MPFIKQERRDVIEKYGLGGLNEIQPGDLCYVHYKSIVAQWRDDPCWTTAHKIFKGWAFLSSEDESVAARLAWEVFFALHILPYELKKREENGDI